MSPISSTPIIKVLKQCLPDDERTTQRIPACIVMKYTKVHTGRCLSLSSAAIGLWYPLISGVADASLRCSDNLAPIRPSWVRDLRRRRRAARRGPAGNRAHGGESSSSRRTLRCFCVERIRCHRCLGDCPSRRLIGFLVSTSQSSSSSLNLRWPGWWWLYWYFS